jgi:transcriptional regulator with XRE-family HTH domain
MTAMQQKPIELEGTRLKTARRRRGLSREELATLVDIPSAALEDWEENRAWCNSVETIQRLAWALKFPYDFFLGPALENLEPWQVNMCRIDYDEMIICAACGEPITGDDLDNRHDGHEEGCPNRDEPDSAYCECGLDYHEKCCPDCNGNL